MDHLPLPSNPIHPPLEIPLLEVENYDGLELLTYPERQNWGTRTVADWRQLFQEPSRAFSAFMDRWLFFGLMDGLFDKRIITSDFIRYVGNPEYPVLTTSLLLLLYQEFADHVNLTGGVGRSFRSTLGIGVRMHARLMVSARQDIDDSHRTLDTGVSLVKFIDSNRAPQDPRTPGIAMATAAMLESVSLVFSQDWYVERVTGDTPNGTGGTASPMWHSLAWTQLMDDGWCPSQLARLFHRFNTCCFHFLRNLTRPGPHESHEMIRIHRSSESRQDTAEAHSSTTLCTAFRCSHRHLNNETYKTRHADGCLGCQNVVADQDEIYRILKNGNIPLILSIKEEDENENIVLTEAEPGIAYVAISHVWSDGLGNLQENALPRCQLLRLSNMVRSLSGEYSDILLFWLDTICVPPDAAGLPEAQQLALGLMQKTYKDATTVLVLDSWLFSTSNSNDSHLEILMKIFSCDWNARLWTYQEGALAKRLHFQLSDTAYDLDRSIQEFYDSADLMTSLSALPVLKDSYNHLRSFRHLKDSIEDKIAAIATALGHRTTSVASDEALCLAVLLDLDVAEIAQTDPKKRMEKFWGMLPSAPAWLLFAKAQTFQTEGLRWAPQTFLRPQSGKGDPLGLAQASTQNFPAIPTDLGLMVRFPGLRFFPGRNTIGQQAFLGDGNGTWIHVTVHHNGPDLVPYRFNEDSESRNFGFNPWTSLGCEEVAIIYWSRSRELGETGTGIMVAIRREVPIHEGMADVIYCQRLCTVLCVRLKPEIDGELLTSLNQRFHNRFYGGSVDIEGVSGTLGGAIGKSCPAEQNWMVA